VGKGERNKNETQKSLFIHRELDRLRRPVTPVVVGGGGRMLVGNSEGAVVTVASCAGAGDCVATGAVAGAEGDPEVG